MIIDFDDACWSQQDEQWNRDLIGLLVLLNMHDQHAIRADPDLMLGWCSHALPLYVDYFKTRMASAQFRANALVVRVLPSGAGQVSTPPPWALTAVAASALVKRPLRLVLENDHSDKLFVEATIQPFKQWCSREWIEPDLGGGAAMEKDIADAAADIAAQWRTFFLFDSDRLHQSELAPGWTPPSGDGCQGYNFERKCAALPASRWHRLNRRSIENYLPQSVLIAKCAATAAALFSPSVGQMANFYNVKKGLAGDGVAPLDPKKAIRAARSQGFWSALAPAEVAALTVGFGPKVSEEFNNVPPNHPWPADVLAEMATLASALQDAI